MPLRWPDALWLVRHGQSVGNVADNAAHEAGAARLDLDVRDPDVDLTDAGVGQAEALGAWLRDQDVHPSVVLVSPYQRATRTAAIALQEAGLHVPTMRDERLRERELGILDGWTGVGIRRQFPDEAQRRERLGKFYYRPPGGESWADVALRVRSVMSTLREEYADERVLIVTHQAVITVFRYALEDLSEQDVLDLDHRQPMANCSVTDYESVEGRLELKGYNDVSHVIEQGESVTDEADAPVTVA